MDSPTQILHQSNFKCEICEKCFKTNHLKNQHLGKVHGEEKKFQCNVCSQIFGEKNKLKSHEDNHHQRGKLKNKCDSCGKYFTQSGNLKYHIKTTHEDAPKKF